MWYSIAIMGMRTIWATSECACNAEMTYSVFDAYAWNGRHPDN